jgi:hypothetical protein
MSAFLYYIPDMEIKKHERHSEIVSKTDFLLNSYRGGLSVLDKEDYIFQYPTETLKAYQLRRMRAVIYNYFRPIINAFTYSIFSKPVKRTANNDNLQRFIKSATLSGKSLGSVMQSISVLSTFLQIGIYVDVERTNIAVLKQEQIEANRLFPYVSIVFPQNIINWYFDNKGLAWVILKDFYTDKADPENIKEVKRYILLTREYWKEYNETATNPSWGEPNLHGLKDIPFRFAKYSDVDNNENDSEWEGAIEEIALCQRQIANWMSALDENIHSTCHSSISIPIGEHAEIIRKAIEEKKNEGAKIQFHEAGSPPVFLRDDLINVQAILTAVQSEVTEIYRMAGLTMQNKQNYLFNQSGTSKEYDFESYNSILVNKSKDIQDTENWILTTVANYYKQDFTPEMQSKYSDDFKVTETGEKIRRVYEGISARISSTFTKYLKKEAVKEIAPTFAEDEPDTYQAVMDEIDNEKDTPPLTEF